MASHPLTRELSDLVVRPGRFKAEYPAWRERCATELQHLSPADARALLEELQTLIQENRSLFEKESEEILGELVDQRQPQGQAAKARRYKDIGKL